MTTEGAVVVGTNQVVEKLKAIDDQYMVVKREFLKKVAELEKEYTIKLDPYLEERSKVLTQKFEDEGDVEETTGTPALPDFWLTVLKNSEEFGEDIEEWDEPILKFLKDIRADQIDRNDADKGFFVEFEFAPNPFFTNSLLRKTYYSTSPDPYTEEKEITKVETTEIDWKHGMNVTVVVEKKKRGGGGAKKKKSAVKETPRDSFFRYFRNLGPDSVEELLEEEKALHGDEEDSDDEDSEMDPMEKLQMLLEDDWERASALQSNIVPHAVRWYTGEAVPEEEEVEGSEDEDTEDESDEDSPVSSKKGKAKNKAIAQAKQGAGPGSDEKPECKQQ